MAEDPRLRAGLPDHPGRKPPEDPGFDHEIRPQRPHRDVELQRAVEAAAAAPLPHGGGGDEVPEALHQGANVLVRAQAGGAQVGMEDLRRRIEQAGDFARRGGPMGPVRRGGHEVVAEAVEQGAEHLPAQAFEDDGRARLHQAAFRSSRDR